jgi:hypothetical protein
LYEPLIYKCFLWKNLILTMLAPFIERSSRTFMLDGKWNAKPGDAAGLSQQPGGRSLVSGWRAQEILFADAGKTGGKFLAREVLPLRIRMKKGRTQGAPFLIVRRTRSPR